MEGRYSLVTQHSGVWRNLRDGDFEEEEIWAVLEDGTGSPRELGEANDYSPVPVSRPLPISSKLIPRTRSNDTSGNSSLEDKLVQQSAPFSSRQWPKAHQNEAKMTTRKVAGFGNDVDYVGDGDHCELASSGADSDDEEEDEAFNNKLPPHEFISRRLARSQITSSVFEGVGRTLKGRDLSKVRNAVLTRTGFLESI